MVANLREKNRLGQYFTPAQICEFMVSLSSKGVDDEVLEPSSGEGAFLDALDKAGFRNVTGVEIDSEIASHPVFPVESCSFISWDSDKLFDLIIGNPPYIRWKDLEQEQKDELTNHRIFGSLVNSLSDYLLPFIALSIEKLKPNGELIFITPSFWLQTKHSSSIRDYLTSHGVITDLVDFGEAKIFKSVATSLIVFKFVKTQELRKTVLHRFLGGNVGSILLNLDDPNLFRSEPVTWFESKGKFIPSFDDEVLEPLKLEEACKKDGGVARLGDIVRIANGMVTGLDEAFKLAPEFVEQLPPRELSGVSKVLKGKDLRRLYSSGFSYYIDISPDLPKDEVWSSYPSLLSHLESWKDRLLKRYAYDDGLKWWLWSFYRSSSFHRAELERAFVPGKERLSHKPNVRFSLATTGVIATQDVTAFAPLPQTRESLGYIVAFLNLKEVSDWVRVFGLMKGGVAEFSEKPLSEIPIRLIDWTSPVEIKIHDSIDQLVREAFRSARDVEDVQLQIRTEFRKLIPHLSLETSQA